MSEEKRIRVRVPGSSANCGPGYDSLGIACSLYNHVELAIGERDGRHFVEIQGEGEQTLPRDERNLVVRSVRAVLDKVGMGKRAIHLRLENRIPLSHGLGSSSSAIVGGLTAANLLTGEQLSLDELLAMATAIEGHPDNVAPALRGGFVISVMDGEQVKSLSLRVPTQLKMVAAIPDFNLSTHKARKVLPSMVSHEDAVFNVSRTALLVGALVSGRLEYLETALQDCLHQPYRASLIPGMCAAFAGAKAAGALGVTISGAGPSLMAYTIEHEDEIGAAMVKAFAGEGIEAYSLRLAVDYQGAVAVPIA